jgi:hypothetical protein
MEPTPRQNHHPFLMRLMKSQLKEKPPLQLETVETRDTIS